MNKRENKKKRPGNGKRSLLIVLCVLLGLILAALIAVAIWLDSTLGLIDRNLDDDPMSQSEYQDFLQNQEEDTDATAVTIDPDDINWDPSSGLLETSENIINILLIGQDAREGQGRQRSDAMILCTVNLQTKTLTMTSFMRDMYVQIPGYGDNRINACYMIGGMPLIDKCLEENFGIDVDGNFEVDFSGFINVIDMLGGVDIELTADEAAYLNRRGNWDVDDSTAGTWNLKKGMNHLTGEQALAYSRIRYIGNGDFGRTDRQRTVLTVLMEKCNGMSVAELNNLLREILPLLSTDMSNSEIINYAMKIFPMFSDMKMNSQRIPAEGTYSDATIRGMSVLVPDLSDNRAILSEAMQK